MSDILFDPVFDHLFDQCAYPNCKARWPSHYVRGEFCPLHTVTTSAKLELTEADISSNPEGRPVTDTPPAS